MSIFMQGCHFHCKNCFNAETWCFDGGNLFTDETIEHVLELCDHDYITGLSILGGEPMHPVNIKGSTKLAKLFKERYPQKTIWAWTGYTYDLLEKSEIINYLDVLVDGKYIDELFNPKLKWRGSENQRVIDINKTRKSNKIILLED